MNHALRHPAQRGMMLLEVMIAILIFAIGVLGVIKMQAVATSNSFNSEDRAIAALAANNAVAALWVAGAANSTPCAQYGNQPMFSVSTAGLADATSACNNAAAVLNNATCNITASINTYCGSALTNAFAVTVKWNRHLGRNVDVAEGSTQQWAYYTTQVVIQ